MVRKLGFAAVGMALLAGVMIVSSADARLSSNRITFNRISFNSATLNGAGEGSVMAITAVELPTK
jgi:hypothetical protein